MSDTNGASPVVMIVDDDVMVVTALRSFLELDTPYRVLTFTNPLLGLEALQHEPVTVIVADFMMPGLDGISFLRRTRELLPFTARILLTGYADKENAIRAINEAGLYYYLEKPWDNEHLKLVIRNAVERSSLLTELNARIAALENAHEELYGMRRRLVQALL